MLRHLPLPEDSTDAADPDNPDPEYRRPFALINASPTPTPTWRYCDRSEDPSLPTGNIVPLDREFGLHVHMHPQYSLALHHETPSGGGSPATFAQPVTYDYEQILATIAVRTDERLCVIVDVPANDPSRQIHIRVPDAESWYIAAHTVTDVAAGALVRKYASPTLLRDDSSRLRQIASLAQTWFGIERSVLELEVQAIIVANPVGSMITSVMDPIEFFNLYTVVTELTWDVAKMTTRIQTNYGEMDFAGLSHDEHPSIR